MSGCAGEEGPVGWCAVLGGGRGLGGVATGAAAEATVNWSEVGEREMEGRRREGQTD